MMLTLHYDLGFRTQVVSIISLQSLHLLPSSMF